MRKLIIGIVALGGCATGPFLTEAERMRLIPEPTHYYTKPGVANEAEEFETDHSACVAAHYRQLVSIPKLDHRLIDLCLRGKGWREVAK